jgi:hypothetical protein
MGAPQGLNSPCEDFGLCDGARSGCSKDALQADHGLSQANPGPPTHRIDHLGSRVARGGCRQRCSVACAAVLHLIGQHVGASPHASLWTPSARLLAPCDVMRWSKLCSTIRPSFTVGQVLVCGLGSAPAAQDSMLPIPRPTGFRANEVTSSPAHMAGSAQINAHGVHGLIGCASEAGTAFFSSPVASCYRSAPHQRAGCRTKMKTAPGCRGLFSPFFLCS